MGVIQKPYVCEIAPNTYAINEYGMAAEYLVVGDERALLIDTGCGLLDLPAIARRFTDKPLDVVLTHGHGDHIGGIGWFEKLHVHPRDFDMVQNADLEGVKHYTRSMAERGALKVFDFDPEAVRPIEKAPELLPVTEGFVFDLGNRRLEVLEAPGHTPGSIVLVDDKARILFSGDACNVNLGLIGAPIPPVVAYLQKLWDQRGRFDQNWNGHVGYLGSPECLPTPAHVLPTCLEICRSIEDGTAEVVQQEWLPGRKVNAVVKNGVRICF